LLFEREHYLMIYHLLHPIFFRQISYLSRNNHFPFTLGFQFKPTWEKNLNPLYFCVRVHPRSTTVRDGARNPTTSHLRNNCLCQIIANRQLILWCWM
jgi:hypothetical protein